MSNKKQYYALDEIGFIGVQDKQTKAQIKKDQEMTGKYIRAMKAGKVFSMPQQRNSVLAKAK